MVLEIIPSQSRRLNSILTSSINQWAANNRPQINKILEVDKMQRKRRDNRTRVQRKADMRNTIANLNKRQITTVAKRLISCDGFGDYDIAIKKVAQYIDKI